METTPKSAKNPYKPALCKIENDYEKKVREEIFDTGEFADVVFLVGAEKRPFKAHRFVLITSSLKFKQMMDLHKDLEKPIIIEEVEPQIFEQLLQVIYLHRLELYSFENAMICSKVFEDFGLAAAVKECQAYLKQPIEITTENAITLFEMNREVPERAETVEECIKLFCFQTHEILKSVGFSRAHASTLAFIFDLPHLTIDSELDLVNALCQFAEMHGALPAHNEDGREDHFKELVRPALEKVHFLALTPKEVVKSAAIRALLSDAEVAGLLATLICPENELYKLPEGFSTATNDRGFAKCPRFADASHETTLPGFANTAEIDSQLTEKTAQGSVDWTPSKIMAQGDDETSGAGTLETGNPIGLNSTQDSSVFAAENETLASDNSVVADKNPEKSAESIVCAPDLGHFSGVTDETSFRSTNGNVSPSIQSVWVKKIDENKNYTFNPAAKRSPAVKIVTPPVKSASVTPPFKTNPPFKPQAPFKTQGQRAPTTPNVQIIPKVVTENDDEWA
ncbi:uncharacterized protein LOC134836700 isoform X2 [Culicoides brevitarsis]|uniref:uncharacterized protein LOC134836700 isoform X2 n=1 Tax=Culicoides brevitarsis TaxID=469753 RepID=UPI00307B6067